ncbi:c-type cytochrome [Lichenihabitans sp. Uapishka_5]|uniref:c-type cytochrome n=1 Tax=Lichenihabitans sp. Uapishka_5 TaxID=3037302 RepID=UPI0029E81EA9|nr:c-type cytochrome [Lichenihabitans sp. Uapishka_5]MDX7951695.1 c-type cytochrome [Lichenihabitans sp. Uapishka_5]
MTVSRFARPWLAGVVLLGLGGLTIALMHGVAGPAPHRRGPADPTADLDTRMREADAGAGAHLFATCAACHSVGRGGVDLDGPNLYGVVGAPVAERRPRYNYSSALRRVGGLWTPARLDAWLTSPAAFAPGTNMPFEGWADGRDRADVIAFLAQQGGPSPP